MNHLGMTVSKQENEPIFLKVSCEGSKSKCERVSRYPNESRRLIVSRVENESTQGRIPAPLKESKRRRVPRYPNES